MKGMLLLVGLLLGLVSAPSADAGEGGSSHYMPGTLGDFAMALIGPKGFYLRNDTIHFEGSIGSVALGDRVSGDAFVPGEGDGPVDRLSQTRQGRQPEGRVG